MHPFHTPANQVAWVANEAAVHFGEDGTILSSGSFPDPGGGVERSIEIWAQPDKIDDSGTLVAFFDSASPRQLSISQSLSDLEVHLESTNAWRTVKTEKMYAPDVFRKGKSAFWTVTFGPSGTAIYRDGELVAKSRMKPSGSEVSGRLVVGNSLFGNSWSGVLQGLAIYNTALNRDQIARHYASWTRGAAPVLISDDACIALYLFNEHTGRFVHDSLRSGNDLYIPTKYLVLRKTTLDPVWRAFEWSPGFWMDTFINVAGFIPFGFFLCAYFSTCGLRSPAFLASSLGFALSAFIELTQAHLPTRDSSMADLINNSVGSVLGAAAYCGVAQAFDRWISWIGDALKRFRQTAKPG